MDFDVLIVGGGPAGLAAGIRLRQLAADTATPISVCLLEKGAEIGAHTLSGAIMDPRALDELLPGWKDAGAPLTTSVTEDRFLFLSDNHALRVPNWLLPDCFLNHGNYIVRLGHVIKWLGEQAETLGVEIYPGFVASEVLFNDDGPVVGVVTGDMGIGRDGSRRSNYQPGMALHAKYTLLAEGCRGHLGKCVEQRFDLREGVDPQTYALGLKELWEVPAGGHQQGLALHTAGWPMDWDTYGGGFVYHLQNGLVAVGLVVGLDYRNPYLSPFEEFQRYKKHAEIRRHLIGGNRLAFGARAIASGGLQSMPRLVFPGGALLGDDAGFLNAARIKGSHAAIMSGKLAAEAVFEALQAGRSGDELIAYPERFRSSWLYRELYQTRNFKPYLKRGLVRGSLLFGLEQKLTGGRVPWTLGNSSDHGQLKPASVCTRIDYPKPDGQLSFDRPSSAYLSNTHHEEDQPCHLVLRDSSVPVTVNLSRYDGPEQHYCPVGVYEFVAVSPEQQRRLLINAQNCIHCKACDIKDPTQNIVWTPPQGGEGPIYQGM